MESMDDTKWCYYAVLIFRVESGSLQTNACSATFETDSVEMMLISPSERSEGVEPLFEQTRHEIDSQVFFMDAYSCFKSANISTRGYTASNIVAMSIKLSQDEHFKMQMYLMEMLRADIVYAPYLLPFILVPAFVASWCSDVNSKNPRDFTRLTSCQACLHTLRNGLEEGRSITANLEGINSRCVSIHRLFSVIEPFSRRIQPGKLKLIDVCFMKL
jgi:hypothetical protein